MSKILEVYNGKLVYFPVSGIDGHWQMTWENDLRELFNVESTCRYELSTYNLFKIVQDVFGWRGIYGNVSLITGGKTLGKIFIDSDNQVFWGKRT